MNMTIKATLDRIENKIAVLLVKPEETINVSIPLSLLPEGSKEGRYPEHRYYKGHAGNRTGQRKSILFT